MIHRSPQLTFALVLLLMLAGTAYAFRYMYFSDCEITVFGDRVKFWHGDTIQGPIRTNGCFAFMQDPQIYDSVIMHGNCCVDSTWPPHNLPGNFYCNAPYMEFPRAAENARIGATIQGHLYSTPHMQGKVILNGNQADCYEWFNGTPFDSGCYHWVVPLAGQVCMFFDYPISVQGILEGQLSIGCSRTIGLADNIRYADANPNTGVTPLSSSNILMLAAEGDIKVLNTPANGRENSHGRGNNQTNPDSTSIVITAALYALGESFTFEQQNDIDSGYVYQYPVGTPHQDDRGTIYLYGSLAQHRRGYTHRSTPAGGVPIASTGYLKQLRYDRRFLTMAAPYEYYDWPNPSTDTLNFGNVAVGSAAWDTAHIYLPLPGSLYSVIANTPFYATRVPPYQGDHFRIPVRFQPNRTGQFSGILYVNTSQRYFQIVLRGRGMPGGEPPHVEIAPNPFNLSTTIRYQLSEANAVKITLFDILGRTVKVLELGNQETGEHTAQLNAADLASGVYFVNLQTNGHALTKKVLLLK